MKKVSTTLGIILGAAVGAGAAYFLAPKSGDETKRIIKKHLYDGSAQVLTATSNVLEAVEKKMTECHDEKPSDDTDEEIIIIQAEK